MRRRNRTEPKHTPGMIIDAFKADKTRKSNFGNFRIEDDALVYRAQSSVEAPRYLGRDEFADWYEKTGVLIRQYDGKLVDGDGKAVMLESLSVESQHLSSMRVQFFEENLVAVKLRDENGLPIFIGNSSTLELVGRSVAYGRVSENRGETDIQREMKKDPAFVMLPLTQLESDSLDVSAVEIIERGGVETVTVQQKAQSYPHDLETVKKQFNPTLFKIENRYFLNDIDRRELKNLHFRPFLSELPGPAQSIRDAYASLVPASVRGAKAEGLRVEQVGDWFFIPCEAPTLPVLTNEERLLILGDNGYRLDKSVVAYLTRQEPASKDEIERLMTKVPRPLTLSKGIGMSSAIEIDGVLYCRREIDGGSANWTNLKLSGWHKPVRNLAKRTDEGGD